MKNEYAQDVILQSEQNSRGWDVVRLGRFTGSGVSNLFKEPRSKADKDAGVMSDTAMNYIVEKAMEVITGQNHNEARGAAIDHGNAWQDHALKMLAEKIESPAEHTEITPKFKVYGEYSGASPDAYMMYKGQRVGVEVKCPYNPSNHYWHSKVIDGPTLKDINPDYYWQVQANIHFHEFPMWLFVSFHSQQPKERIIHIAEILPCVPDIELLVKKMEQAEVIKQQIIKDWTNKI